MKNKCHVNWFEIMVTDFDKAIDFYGALFGWEFRELKDYDGEYWTIFTGFNSPGGGLLKREEGDYSKQSTRIYVETDDIDLILEKALQSGGTVRLKKKLVAPSSGYYALLDDPDGNTIGLWSAK